METGAAALIEGILAVHLMASLRTIILIVLALLVIALLMLVLILAGLAEM